MSNNRDAIRYLGDCELVIYDKDGTLVDVHHYWSTMVILRAELLSDNLVTDSTKRESFFSELVDGMGVVFESNRLKPEGPVGIKNRAFIANVVLDVCKKYEFDVTLNYIFDVFDQADATSIPKICSFVTELPAVSLVIKSLNKKNIKQAVATSDRTERANASLDCLNLSQYFDLVIGGEIPKNTKPAPDQVNIICDQLGISPQNSIVVGDSSVDLEMARAAGAKFLGVGTGLSSDSFKDKSDFFVPNLSYLVSR